MAHSPGEAAGTFPRVQLQIPLLGNGVWGSATTTPRNHSFPTPKTIGGIFLPSSLLRGTGSCFQSVSNFAGFIRGDTELSLLQETHSCYKLLLKSVESSLYHCCEMFLLKIDKGKDIRFFCPVTKRSKLPYSTNKTLKVYKNVSVISTIIPKAALEEVRKPGKRLTGKPRRLELSFDFSVLLLVATTCR